MLFHCLIISFLSLQHRMTATASEIQRLIECAICCGHLVDVRQTPCCNQLFCLSCIQTWLRKPTKNCPRCQSTTLTEQTLLKNAVVQRFVDNLQFDCPNQLQGCTSKICRIDLTKHERTCSYTPDKITEKNRIKLQETRSLLLKYKEGKTDMTDNTLYDLAQLFFNERDYNSSKECLKLIKDTSKMNASNFIMLQARIEHENNQYDTALEFYSKAYSQARSISQRIALLSLMGELHSIKAEYECAKHVLTQALDLLPENDCSSTKAQLLNALGRIAKKCSNVRLVQYSITTFDE
jgi:hypothetical protein